MAKKKKGSGRGNAGGGGAEQQNTAEEPKKGPAKEEKKDAAVAEEKKEGGGGGGGGEKQKEDGPFTVVLRVDMHCEGCIRKIRRSVRGFPGVEGVAVDAVGHKLTVVGRVDPWELRDRVAAKTHKLVELLSPTNIPRKETAPKEQMKPDDNKPKVPVVSTVVLRIRLHCQGCVQRIRRILLKIKGVEVVTVEVEKDMVTVKGTMDPKLLPAALKAKMRREVEVVPPKKEGGGGGGEKKEKVGGEKKEKGGEGEKKEKEGEPAAAAAEASKLDYYGGCSYRIEMVHAPQLFSDENPNACAVM